MNDEHNMHNICTTSGFIVSTQTKKAINYYNTIIIT